MSLLQKVNNLCYLPKYVVTRYGPFTELLQAPFLFFLTVKHINE